MLALWIHESFQVDALALIAEFFDTILAVELWFWDRGQVKSAFFDLVII